MSINPKLKCLFMSGYTADAISHHGVLEDGVNFIHKPFSLPDLAVKVRKVLDDESQLLLLVNETKLDRNGYGAAPYSDSMTFE